MYDNKGRYDQAISDFVKAIELNPNYAIAYYGRALVYYHKQEYDRAWADVHKAESLGNKLDSGFIESLRKASGRDDE